MMRGWLFFWGFFLCLVTPGRAQLNQFIGSAQTQQVASGDSLQMVKLLTDFGYVDSQGKTWHVPAGAIIDESTIPRSSWVPMEAPLTSAYRNAAIIHNYYCKQKKEHWFSVHRMFYEACLATGLSEAAAKTLFARVFAFTQRWNAVYDRNRTTETAFRGYELTNVSVPEADFIEVKHWIDTKNIPFDEIIARLHCSQKEKKERRLFKPDRLRSNQP